MNIIIMIAMLIKPVNGCNVTSEYVFNLETKLMQCREDLIKREGFE